MIALISVVLMKHESEPSQLSPKISAVPFSIFSKGMCKRVIFIPMLSLSISYFLQYFLSSKNVFLFFLRE